MLSAGKTGSGNDYRRRDCALWSTRLPRVAALQVSSSTTFAERGKLQPYGRALGPMLQLVRDNKRAVVAAKFEGSADTDKETAHWSSKRQAMLDFSEENDTGHGTPESTRTDQTRKQLLSHAARWLVSNRKTELLGFHERYCRDLGLIDYEDNS